MRLWIRYERQHSAMRHIYRGIRRRAAELGGLECRLWTPVRPQFLAEGGWSPDAMILIGHSPKAVADRDALNIPAVYIDVVDTGDQRKEAPPGWPVISLDDRAVGRMAAHQFMSLGLRHFALLNQGWKGVEGPRSGAFIKTLEKHDLKVEDLCSATGHLPFDEGDGPGPLRVISYLQEMPRPFGLFCTNDALAELALDWCMLAGLRVPQDVAVLGTGDDPLHVPDANVPLSSIHLPFWSMGVAAVDFVAKRLLKQWQLQAPKLRKRIASAWEGEIPEPLRPLGVTMRASTSHAYATDAVAQAAIEAVNEDEACSLTVEALSRTARLQSESTAAAGPDRTRPAIIARYAQTARGCGPGLWFQ